MNATSDAINETYEPAKCRVLLAEDEPMLAASYRIIIKSQGFNLDCAANGEEALDFCRQNRYDFILLDLMMPVLDGIGFLNQLNDNKCLPQDGRIILLSNLSSDTKINEAMELGADSYVQKSALEPKQLLALLKQEPARL